MTKKKRVTNKNIVVLPPKPKMSELIDEAARFITLAKANEPGLMTWMDAFHGSARRMRELLDNARESGVENDTWGKA